jgi:TolB protein
MFWPRTGIIGRAQHTFCCFPVLSRQPMPMITAPDTAEMETSSRRPTAGREHALWLIIALLLAAALGAPAALAQQPQQRASSARAGQGGGPLEVNITQGTLQPIPIAVPDFLGEEPQLARDVTQVASADLERSGLFQPLDPAAFIDRPSDLNVAPRFADWRVLNAQALLLGRVGRAADGRIVGEFRLWDVFSGRQLAAPRFAVAQHEWRRLGHLIADQVYQRLTGERGYFDTQIVFVDETGPKDHRNKRLALMDQDGANVRLLSEGRQLVLTPRFSPTAQQIAYMQYTGEQPHVFLLHLENGQRELVGNFPGMTFAPRFSPDGQRVVMSIGEQGVATIIEMDLRSRQMRRLTETNAIDTGPCYSPDGRAIVFESDRDGTQQLYVMNADGSGMRRISFGDGRYSTPVWSPRGDLIAFTKQTAGSFLIGVMHPDGSGERVLTEGFHNEGPSWAPNGRVVMFFRESRGPTGGPKLYSIDLTGYNERLVATPAFASDPAWSPLRN